MNIISASRRTDIPAFYMPWLMNRLDAGIVHYPNPFSGQVHSVSLRPEDVHSFVFWSKHYGPLLPYLDELGQHGYRFYFHYTMTGAPRLLEPHVPSWQHNVRIAHKLAARTSPRHVQWRFDPILFTDELTAEHYLTRFRQLAHALDGATTRCYFSFAAFYGKVERRIHQHGIRAYDPPLAEKQALVNGMVNIATDYGITLYACCQDALVDEHVQKAHCVDGNLLAELFPDRPLVTLSRPTRDQCGCFASRDIGMYDSCAFGCVYCYANSNHDRAIDRLRNHNPSHHTLISDPAS
jgi:hypothetical protein